jgi:hypothetical protein
MVMATDLYPVKVFPSCASWYSFDGLNPDVEILLALSRRLVSLIFIVDYFQPLSLMLFLEVVF